VTCGEVRGWGGTISFKAKFASVNWSSKTSSLTWLLAALLLLMISIPYHSLHTHRHRGGSRFEKRENTGRPNWSDLSPAYLTALLKSWNSLITYAYVQNAYSDPIQNEIKSYRRFNALAKKVQNTIDTKHKKRSAHYEQLEATRSTFTRLCSSVDVS